MAFQETRSRIGGALGVVVVAAALSLGSVHSASASLIGDEIFGCTNTVYGGTVTVDPTACAPQAAGFSGTATVGAGVEFTVVGGAGSREVDFGANTVSIIYGPDQGSPSSDLYVFTGLDFLPTPMAITGLTLLTSNSLNITTAFTANSIGLLVNDPMCCTELGATVTYRIDTVPEPGTLTLLGLGLVGLVRRRWSR